MTPEEIPDAIARGAARALLDTPGDQPGPDDLPGEDVWADYMARHVLAAVFDQIWGIGYAAAHRDINPAETRAQALDWAAEKLRAMADEVEASGRDDLEERTIVQVTRDDATLLERQAAQIREGGAA